MPGEGTTENVGAVEPGEQARRRRIRRMLPLGVLVLGAAAYFVLDLDRYLALDSLRENRAELLAFVAAHRIAALLAYVAIYVAVIAMSLPGGALMTITGGFLFGVVQASIGVVIGATSGATILFLIAKTALGDPLRAKAGPWLKALEKGVEANALSYLLVLRLVPLFPFFVVNLVPAFLGVRLGTYVLATIIGITPAVVVFTTVGAGLGSILDSGEPFSPGSVLTPQVIAGLCGLAALALIPVIYKRFRARREP